MAMQQPQQQDRTRRREWISALVNQKVEFPRLVQVSCGEDKKKKATYGEEGGHVEAEEHIGVVEEVADAHGSWWARQSGYSFS
jgi:hypothetical protein